MQPLFPYLLDELHAIVSRGVSGEVSEVGPAADSPPWHQGYGQVAIDYADDAEIAMRSAVAHAVRLLPATCRDARALAKLDELRWAWLCAFEAFRQAEHPSLRLFDGFPECIADHRSLAHGTRSLGDDEARKYLSLRRGMNDSGQDCNLIWCAFAVRLSADEHLRDDAPPNPAQPAPEDTREHTRGLRATEAMPGSLPLRVRIFAGFVRWSWRMTKWVRDDYQPNPCARRGCAREAHCAAVEGVEFSQGALRVPWGLPPEQQSYNHQVYAYWRTVKSIVDLAHTNDAISNNLLTVHNQRFCSAICAQQVWNEYDRCVRCATFEELDTPMPEVRTSRPANPSRLYHAALDRNAAIARRMRAQPLTDALRHWAVGFDPVLERQQWVYALNLDTAMLQASAMMAELPAARRVSQKAVPKHANFRGLGAVWINALSRVNRILAKKQAGGRRGAGPVLAVNRFTEPPWYQAVKDAALRVF